MKKVLITGASGTVGTAFIEKYYTQYKFYSYSRNEKMQVSLKREYENVEIILGSIEDKYDLINAFLKVKPDIVIHAAALKHVDTGEKQPIQAIRSNIIGSLNVIEASILAEVPISIGISTDKACSPDNVYGYTKSLMEKMYLEINNDKTKFNCCRFGNIAGSHGSVIPYWFRLLESGQPLRLTHKKMNRLMFLPSDAASLIYHSIQLCEKGKGGLIISKDMKSVNMYDFACEVLKYKNFENVTENIVEVGIRSGEKLDENLINIDEINFTYRDGDYIIIDPNIAQPNLKKIPSEVNSFTAQKMCSVEMQKILQEVDNSLHKTLLTLKQY